MIKSVFGRLDAIALEVANGDFTRSGVLSTGETLYVALAANSIELLEQVGYTIAEALARLDAEWTAELISRWRYKGNPRKFPP